MLLEFDTIIPQNMVLLAGFNSNDLRSRQALKNLLAEWDYNTEASAYIAYSKYSIERLQLLLQIAGLLKDGMGFSQLYNMLEPRRGQHEREKALAAGKKLQAWTGLKSSTRLRSFVEEHEEFLCGRVTNGKWESEPSQYSDSRFCNTMVRYPLETSSLSAVFTEKLTQILSMRFSNGYRINSPIELTRFRSFATEDLGKEITLSDEELKKAILACGTIYGGKLYVISVQTENRVKELAEKYFINGAQTIFFSEFYSKNEEWLLGTSIVSQDMLNNIFFKLFPNLTFTQSYFGYTDAPISIVIENEILRVWGDNVLLTYGQIAERLPYVPIERIISALGQNEKFIWHGVRTYSHLDKFSITDEERENICETAIRECNAHGYVSITNLPIGEIAERNYKLSVTAIHNAVFRHCLSDKFDQNGKIITYKGNSIDIRTIIKDYCLSIDKCSLNDLLNYERELTGEVHRWAPMECANTFLVRINECTYVSDKYVYFDSPSVDAAIELSISRDFLPLKSFVTFGAFPDCGQTWNLFLLESYCRRFSKKFRFDVLAVNSQNIGAVIRKSCNLKYTEIMAEAVADAGIPLTVNDVGDFLLNSGYIGRRRVSRVREIIDIAKASPKRVD